MEVMLCNQLFSKYPNQISKNELLNAFNLEIFSYHIVQKAIEEFYFLENLKNFDPIVGDSSCQIRSDKVLEIYLKKKHNDSSIFEIYELISSSVNTLQDLKKSYLEILNKNSPKEIRLFLKKLESGGRQFLVSHNMPRLELSEELIFLTLSYLVTNYYSQIEVGKVQLNKSIGDKFSLSQKYMSNICDEARRKLNLITINHLIILGQYLSENNTSKEIQYFNNALIQIEVFGPWKSHSAYIGFNLLLKKWLFSKIPILLTTQIICVDACKSIHNISNYFEPDPELQNYQLMSGNKKFIGKAGIVLKGISDLTGKLSNIDFNELEKLLAKETDNNIQNNYNCPEINKLQDQIKKIGIKNILLTTAATHNQFVDKEKEINFIISKDSYNLKKNYEWFNELAIKEGLCKTNSSTLRLIHIYPTVFSSN